MATLATQTINRAGGAGGTAITTAAATGGGDAMSCGPSMMLEVINAGASSSTVTFAVPATRVWESGVAIGPLVRSVEAGATRFIGPIDAQTFADPTTSLCTITYNQVTSVTVAAIQLNLT